MLRVSLIAYTPEPEKVVAAAAKLCYSSAGVDDLLAGLTPEKSREFVEKLAKLGHESPTEHVSFTFAIEGVSRSLLAQITRHRHRQLQRAEPAAMCGWTSSSMSPRRRSPPTPRLWTPSGRRWTSRARNTGASRRCSRTATSAA